MCLRKAALKAFPQVELMGGNWLNQFLGGVARYIREHGCADADDRLTKAYFEAAAKLGAKLQVADLLGDEATRRVLKECFAPFVARDAVERIAESFCDTVNLHVATKRGIGTADPAKVTEGEVKKFLTLLPPQLTIAFGAQAAAWRQRASSRRAGDYFARKSWSGNIASFGSWMVIGVCSAA